MNTLESCALDYNQDGFTKPIGMLSFNFIECVEVNASSMGYATVAIHCAKQVGQPGVDKIIKCMNGPQGNALEHK